LPELPEAETMARDLDRLAAGRTILEVAVSWDKTVDPAPAEFAEIVAGAEILSVGRLGKRLRFSLSEGRLMMVQLKMTGQFRTGPWPGESGASAPAHARAAFRLSGPPKGGDALFFCDVRKFGRIHALRPDRIGAYLEKANQGPDPLEIGREEFWERLRSRKGRLKAALLDQSFVAGLGNIYVDESLFAAGLSPLKPVPETSEPEAARLHSEMSRILSEAVDMRGSTVSNYNSPSGPGSFQDRHLAYGRSGLPCPRCGGTMEKIRAAGRGSVLCPNCQK
jgi:formamidopyrimidine-DNA glycosylase